MPSAPGIRFRSLSPPYPCPLLCWGRWRSFLGVREAGHSPAPALRDGARSARRSWSYLQRNCVKAECFSKRKRTVRLAGRGPCRTRVPGESSPGIVLLDSLVQLGEDQSSFYEDSFVDNPIVGTEYLWACRRFCVSCKRCVCVFPRTYYDLLGMHTC